MPHKKIIILFYSLLFFGKLWAQTDKVSEHSFYRSRIVPAPEPVVKKFTEAGMNPTNHVLSQAELQKLDKAFSLLPPVYKKLLSAHLHSISFMDNMPNTALTSTLETGDSSKQFNITFRAGILHETISEWATRKEQTLFDTTANSALSVHINAGKLDAIVYVLLHEATHVVAAVLKLVPGAGSPDSLLAASPFTANIWRSFNKPAAAFSDTLLEKTRFRGGPVQPVTSATAIYKALSKSPFVSLYATASCYEDLAELLTIYHLSKKLHQPFMVYVSENGKLKFGYIPMKNSLVKKRLKLLEFLYQE